MQRSGFKNENQSEPLLGNEREAILRTESIRLTAPSCQLLRLKLHISTHK